MKILLACEGQSEVYLIKNLIERGHLSFDHPLLLDEPIKLRQLVEIAPIINSLPKDEDLIVFRIGDTLKDELSLLKFEMRSNHIKVFKVCTKPEIEILVIINENLFSEFNKKTKNTKPKSFVREKIKDFEPEDYFSRHDMLNDLIEYKRLKNHKKDEMYLIDLIRKGDNVCV